jgi:hypothetical protein
MMSAVRPFKVGVTRHRREPVRVLVAAGGGRHRHSSASDRGDGDMYRLSQSRPARLHGWHGRSTVRWAARAWSRCRVVRARLPGIRLRVRRGQGPRAGSEGSSAANQEPHREAQARACGPAADPDRWRRREGGFEARRRARPDVERRSASPGVRAKVSDSRASGAIGSVEIPRRSSGPPTSARRRRSWSTSGSRPDCSISWSDWLIRSTPKRSNGCSRFGIRRRLPRAEQR